MPSGSEIILGDNLELLPGLQDDCFQLIYIDPPFNTGKAQTRKTLETVPDANGDRTGFMGRRYKLPDAEGRLRPVPDLLADALERARGYAHELNCGPELDVLPALLERGGGAGRRRGGCEIAGMDSLLRELPEPIVAGIKPQRGT